MEAVAEELGVRPLFLPELRRDISPLLDVAAVRRVRALIQELRPHILHTHTAKAGTVGRVAAALSGNARPPVVVHTFHGHVLRGYFGPVQSRGFLQIERRLASLSDALVAVSPEVRDDLVRFGVAHGREDRRDPARARPRRRVFRRRRQLARRSGRSSVFRTTRSSSAGSDG